MEYKKLDEIIEFNPKENIAKKQLAKKISMDNVGCFTKYIKSYSLEEYNGGMKFRNEDTLLARITPCLENGKTSKVTILDENEVGFGSTEYIVMRSRKGISDEDFIFYLAISPKFRDIAIKSMTGTSGRQRVQLDVVKNTEMLVPSYQEQVKIGKILSNIDKKIELNNQINNNLYKFIKDQYNKFMNELSEYQIIKLKDIAIIGSGKRPKVKGNKFEIPLIGASGIMSYTDSNNFDDDIIIIGRVGTLGIVQRYFNKIWASDNTLTIKTDFKNVIENYMKKVDYISLNRGSTQPLITQTDISNLDIKYNKIEFEQFENRIKVIREKIYKNEIQNKTLEQLRNTLLPKLMNGEIDLDKMKI